ncbi:hypothetical protein GCM10011413_18230 [Pedobacter psychrotolerans]|uniref:Uncharacterized protein n=1 Tax=Pedobacter psychrotolerans TaxID=1843235 RepID=A0ABQ1SR56_9SPHI|nr:hypothetical protein GCM10011413_18230 [Pedobacter psychrotolerans]
MSNISHESRGEALSIPIGLMRYSHFKAEGWAATGDMPKRINKKKLANSKIRRMWEFIYYIN